MTQNTHGEKYGEVHKLWVFALGDEPEWEVEHPLSCPKSVDTYVYEDGTEQHESYGCDVQFELDNLGAAAFDKPLELGWHLIQAWHEVFTDWEGHSEYDGGIAIVDHDMRNEDNGEYPTFDPPPDGWSELPRVHAGEGD